MTEFKFLGEESP